jgi:uncharacterized membrane protein SirB2
VETLIVAHICAALVMGVVVSAVYFLRKITILNYYSIVLFGIINVINSLYQYNTYRFTEFLLALGVSLCIMAVGFTKPPIKPSALIIIAYVVITLGFYLSPN